MVKKLGKVPARRLGVVVGIAAAVAVTVWCLFGGWGRVQTENAYVKVDKLSLAPEVSGIIAEVAVGANQEVRRGDLLVRLNDTPLQLAVDEAEAHLAQVRNQLLARRADYAEAEAALRQAQQDADYYGRRLARNEKLGRAALSEAHLDESRQQLARAQAQIVINTEKLASLRAELGGDPLLPLEEQAGLRVAQAQLDKARYRLSRTRIVAPVDGVIANEVPQTGEMAPVGIGVISMLSDESVWVEANLKETELARVRAGQQAEVILDAYPDFRWQAQVVSLSPASGSESALIPPQNASGNWAKVVQRIPVRLRLYPAKEAPTLRAGMSARVSIDTTEDGKLVAARASGARGGRVVLAE